MKDFFASQAKELAKTAASFNQPELEETYWEERPLFHPYIEALEFAYPAACVILDKPPLRPLRNIIEQAELSYGIGSTNSPIYESHFNMWMLFDLEHKKTSLADFAIALAKALQKDQSFINILENLKASHMGIYSHQGHVGNNIYLKDIETQKTYLTASESPYRGQAGEIWMARLAPAADQYIALTTPYLIDSSKKDWQDYFNQHSIHTADEYKSHMKGGRCYWLNYLWTHCKTMQNGLIVIQGPLSVSTLPTQ